MYQDIDYSDKTALHLWLTNSDGKIVGLACVFWGNKAERLQHRACRQHRTWQGYGMLIFQKSLDAVREYFPEVKLVKIEAQLTKLHFYERFGFVATSEPFMLEGLMHIDMELKLQ